jgi:hypothetical protein
MAKIGAQINSFLLKKTINIVLNYKIFFLLSMFYSITKLVWKMAVFINIFYWLDNSQYFPVSQLWKNEDS